MVELNSNFANLANSYLFSRVAKEVREYKEAHPDANVIRMDIGDVTRPICQAGIEAMHHAVDDLGTSERFHGYGPEQGYAFLREAIARDDYAARGIDIAADEIFISDGAKSDIGNLGEIFSRDCSVGILNPAYPVYIDDNVIDGRTDIVELICTPENGFSPAIPDRRVDLVYLCYPNNPTGVTLTREQLKAWVDYARRNGSVILFDSAYEAYIRTPDVPHSIYEIPGAKEVAIEIRSFSKTAGFTGLRCGYTVIPHALKRPVGNGHDAEVYSLWNRRQTTKFNGASYVSQRAAEAVYSEAGKQQVKETVDYYMENARILKEGIASIGLEVFGGTDSPYVWIKMEGKDSWDTFHWLLENANVTSTPGSGFGTCGEGYVRLTAFNTRENTIEAIRRIKALFA